MNPKRTSPDERCMGNRALYLPVGWVGPRNITQATAILSIGRQPHATSHLVWCNRTVM